MITVSCALLILATPHTTRAQKNGDPQAVIFDAQDRPTLRFSDKDEKLPRCGFFLSYTLMENQEEALAVKVDHVHRRVQIWGGTSFPERGWLYITPSRVVFTVDEGDKSHSFDVPRTDLKDKPGTRFRNDFAGVQINLKERLEASDSREQKFAFLITQEKKCDLYDPSRFNKFVERAVNDFTGAMAEFKQIAASLKEAGQIRKERAFALPTAAASQPAVPADGVYTAMISRIIFAMGRTEEAKAKAEEALRLLASRKNDLEFYWAKAEANYVLGNYDVSIANADKAIELNPEHLGARQCRAMCYLHKRDYELALADFDKVIQIGPRYADAYYNRGIIYYYKRDYDRAIADFDKVTELNPKATGPYIYRGLVHFDKGDDNRAIAEYSEVIRQYPDYIMAYQNRAKVYERMGDKAKAQADLDQVVQLEKQKAKP